MKILNERGFSYRSSSDPKNAEALRSIFSEYVEKGRKAAGGRRNQGGQKSSSTSPSTRKDTQQIRRWAKDNGYTPSSRGRITQSIIDAYNKSH